jgi:hypothetical protein
MMARETPEPLTPEEWALLAESCDYQRMPMPERALVRRLLALRAATPDPAELTDCEALCYVKCHPPGECEHHAAATPDPAEPGLALDQRLLGQCPGCWAVHRLPSTADYECECGERVTVIDLRPAALSDTTEGQS